MTTQYERDQLRNERDARRLHALVSTATDVLYCIEEDTTARDALSAALDAYNLHSLTNEIAYYDGLAANRKAEEDRIAANKRTLDELPDSPPRMQCHAEVARDMGRWTDFGRCEKAATCIVLDRENKRERVLCTIHAKEWTRLDKPGSGWYDEPRWLRQPNSPSYARGNALETHESWYRIKGWCMVKVGDRYCKVRVDKGSGKHEGDHK